MRPSPPVAVPSASPAFAAKPASAAEPPAFAGVREEADVFAQFARWVRTYRATPEAERTRLIPEGTRLAVARQPLMIELLARDPARACALAVAGDDRAILPPAVANLVERRVSGRGSLMATRLRRLDRGRFVDRVVYTAHLDGASYRASVYGSLAVGRSFRDIPLLGVVLKDVMALLDRPFDTERTNPDGTVAIRVAGEARTLKNAGEADALARTLEAERIARPPEDVVSLEAEDVEPDVLVRRMREHDPLSLVDKKAGRASFSAITKHLSIRPVRLKDGNDYHQVIVPAGSCRVAAGRTPGLPDLPVLQTEIRVPDGAVVKLAVDRVAWADLPDGYEVAPLQRPIPDLAGFDDSTIPFEKDAAAYAQDRFLNENPVAVVDLVRADRRTFAVAEYRPISYNPATRKLRVATSVEWHLEYDAGAVPPAAKPKKTFLPHQYPPGLDIRLAPDAGAAMPEGGGATGGDGEPVPLGDLPSEGGISSSISNCQYLIIAHTNFYDGVLPLATWLHRKGIPTYVAKYPTETGSATNQILACISNAYHNGALELDFVLLVGDSEHIPGYQLYHSYHSANYANDFRYSCVDGSDWYPDVAIGRLTAKTPVDLAVQTDRILKFDIAPEPGTWYRHALMAGDPESGRWFLEDIHRVADFMGGDYDFFGTWNGFSGDDPFNKGYTVHPVNSGYPVNYYTGSYSYRLTPPDPVPQKWKDCGTGGRTQISAWINQGVSFVMHRDHGSDGGWYLPGYGTADVQALVNGNKVPVVFSINCLTGNFDGDYFADAWPWNRRGGSLAYYGHKRVSYSGENDTLHVGIMDSLWDDYSTYSSATYPASRRFGELMNRGKAMIGFNYAGEDATVNFHLLGDPAQQFREQVPEQLAAQHPGRLRTGVTTNLTVNVRRLELPFDGATAALVMDPAIYQAKTSAGGGKATFPFTTPVSEGTILVTVSERDSIPYLGHIYVTDKDLVVRVEAVDGEASELGANAILFRVTRLDPDTHAAVAAGVTTVGFTLAGTAVEGVDFYAVGTSITIPEGAASADVAIVPIDDTLVEGNETVILTLGPTSSAYLISSEDRATGTIKDNDARFTIAATDTTAAETGGDNAVFTVTRAAGFEGPVTVYYSVDPASTATAADIQTLSGSLAFTNAQASATLTIVAVDDAIYEPNETVIVRLDPHPTYAVGSPSNATITISQNDNVSPAISIVKPVSELVIVSNTAVTLDLQAQVTDDGFPNAATVGWTKRIGPAVTFASTSGVSTAVSITNAGHYVFRATVSDGLASAYDEVSVTVSTHSDAVVAGSGINREWWTGISGSAVSNLTSSSNYPARPTGRDVITNLFEAPANWADSYGQRIHGYFCAPASGTYKFYIASDDLSELWLSTGLSPSNISKIAWTTASVGARVYTNHASQASSNITLAAGQAYYIRALHKESSGSEHLSVAALFPGDTNVLPIAAAYLSVFAESITNRAPRVDAGPDASPVVGEVVSLPGVASDDGNPAPPGALTVRWGKTAGIGPATFANSNAAATTVTFAEPGLYTLDLTATDGDVAVRDSAVFNVTGGDAGGTIRFATNALVASEAALVNTVRVSRAGGSTGAVTATYTSSNGTAAASSDYYAVSGTLSWTNGETAEKWFTLTNINDTVDEPDETVVLLLTGVSGAAAGACTSLVFTIVDNDPTPLPGTVQFLRGNFTAGESLAAVTVTVTRANGSLGAASVNYSTSNGTAAAGLDYTAASGTLSWTNGETAAKTFAIPLLGDTADEPDETVLLYLSQPVGVSLGAQKTAKAWIVDDDDGAPAGAVQFVSASVSATEDAGRVAVSVARVGGSTGTASVVCATAGGTATAGSDYTAATGTLSWADAETGAKTFWVTLADDFNAEDAETICLVLSNAVGAVLGCQTSAVVSVEDNDEGGQITFKAASFTAAEGAGAVTARVLRVNGLAAVTVKVVTSNGTAAAGADYTATSTTVSWAYGDLAEKIVAIPVVQDLVYEGDEKFWLHLKNPAGATLGNQPSAELWIADDEIPGVLQFTTNAWSAGEADGTALIGVTRSGGSFGAVTVRFSSSNGTATAGSDYTATNGTLAWADGEQGEKFFGVRITSDIAEESNETVNLYLSNPTNAPLGTVKTAVLTIRDDDREDSLTEEFTADDLDLNGKKLTFVWGGSKYAAYCNPVAAFPTDPSGGTTVTLTDDAFQEVFLPAGRIARFCGTNYTNLFINSNGNISFVSGDSGIPQTAALHYARRRVAGLSYDLDPARGGTISYRVIATAGQERTVVTYKDVKHYQINKVASFQIELWENGTVTITWLGSTILSGLCGISDGSIPPTYVESDLSACPPLGAAGVNIVQSGGSTTVGESGATDTYTMILAAAPSASVTVAVNPGIQLGVSSSNLVFTTANWSNAQTVVVSAVNDAVPEGTHTGTVTHAVSSTDTNYNGLAVSNVVVTILDDDLNQPPVASFTASPTNGTYPLAVSFNASASSDPDGDPLAYTWAFGDGGTGSGVTNSHTYTNAGNFTAFLTVTDGRGGTGTASRVIGVTAPNGPPVAVADSSSAPEDTAKTIAVLANDTDPNGDSLSVQSVTQPVNGSASCTTTNVTYTPNLNFNGTNVFTYVVSDGKGGIATGTVTVTVTAVNDAPAASFTASPTNGPVPLSVTFNGAASSDADGDALTFAWAFGDGHTGGGATNVHVYTNAGSFTAVLTVTDGKGGTNTVSRGITATFVNGAPVASNDTYGVAEDALLNVPAPGVLGNDWDPDGHDLSAVLVSNVTHGVLSLNTSDGSFTYTPSTNWHGADTFRYRASDGLTNSALVTVTINVSPVNDTPVAVGAVSPTNGFAPLAVSFNGASSSDADGDPLAYDWDLGDGRHTNAVAFDGAYATAGVYTVRLTVTDGQGGTNSAVTGVSVEAGLTVAVAATPTSGWMPLQVQLSALASGGSPAAGAVHWNPALLTSYDLTQDKTGLVEVLDSRLTLRLSGNLWKAYPLAYTVTTNTILEFDFASTNQGEVHGIGLDSQKTTINPARVFQLYGAQSWGYTDYADYAAAAPGWKRYAIPVGQHFTGTVAYLVLASDHDVTVPDADGRFRQVRVYERGAAAGYTYSWDFGDGSEPSTQPSPLHLYSAAGIQTATVTVAAGSLSATGTVQVVVNDPDLDDDGMEDAWEVLHFGAIDAPDGDPDADPDGDRMNNFGEYRAGTLPNEPASVLRFDQVRLPEGGTNVVVVWQSVTNKTYVLLKSTNLPVGFNIIVESGIQATPPLNTATDSVPGVPPFFYRIRLEE